MKDEGMMEEGTMKSKKKDGGLRLKEYGWS
jgi:hypothetical protein